VTVDTPALMEKQGKYHDQVNCPSLISHLITDVLAQDGDRIVILVPLKCESYISLDADIKALQTRVINSYGPLLDTIMKSGAACVLAPVQTLGSVIFESLEELQSREAVFHYRAKRPGAAYSPVDTEQLLLYTLRFAIGKSLAGRRGLYRPLWSRVGKKPRLSDSVIEEFTARSKTGDGFAMLRDHPYLRRGT
jgi:hypothetical protein